MGNNTGASVYQFASGATDVNFGPQQNLCSGALVTDYQEFISTTAPVIPGGSGWPTGTSITGNDHSCSQIPVAQTVDYMVGTYLGQLNGISFGQMLFPWQTFTSGNWYTNNTGSENGNANTGGNGDMLLMPFFVGQTNTFTGIGVWVVTGGSSGCVLRLGIYNTTAGIPNTVALDAGTVGCTSTGAVASITISKSLGPGLYWLAVAQQGSPVTSALIDGQYNNTPGVYNSTIQVGARGSYFESGVTGALPTFSGGGTSWFAPNIYLQAQ